MKNRTLGSENKDAIRNGKGFSAELIRGLELIEAHSEISPHRTFTTAQMCHFGSVNCNRCALGDSSSFLGLVGQ